MLNISNRRHVSMAGAAFSRHVRLGVSLTGLMLAGSALSPGFAATVDLAGANLTLPGIAGNTIYTNSGAPARLTLNPGGTSSFGGSINNAGGAIAVTKSGAGRQDFTQAM